MIESRKSKVESRKQKVESRKPTSAVVGRFAPSPTGEMHLGNVLAALLSWLSARQQGGMWRLRIEDLDPQRSRQEYADRLMRDLEWLGLTWDGEVVYQSERTEVYAHYLARLSDLTYPCTCTRNEILAAQAPHESDGRVVYPGTCRPKEVSHAWLTPTARPAATRIIVPDEVREYDDRVYGRQAVNLATHCGDFILRRSDGVFAYQLAVVVDDAEAGVTEIVRGRDLLLSTAQQLYLYRLLGFEAPVYMHHPLLVNGQGQRLCKRDKAMAIGAMREHMSAEQIIGKIAYAFGWTDAAQSISANELIPLFRQTDIPQHDLKIPIE